MDQSEEWNRSYGYGWLCTELDARVAAVLCCLFNLHVTLLFLSSEVPWYSWFEDLQFIHGGASKITESLISPCVLILYFFTLPTTHIELFLRIVALQYI